MPQKLTFTSRIVQNVTHEKEYHLYTDRFYTYFDLAWEFYKRKVHISWTVLQNRKDVHKEIKKKSFKHAHRKQLFINFEGQKNGHCAEYIS